MMVKLMWNKSTTPGVDDQIVSVFGEDGVKYVDNLSVGASTESLVFDMPTGALCYATITTIKQAQKVTSVSQAFSTPSVDLAGATNLTFVAQQGNPDPASVVAPGVNH